MTLLKGDCPYLPYLKKRNSAYLLGLATHDAKGTHWGRSSFLCFQ